MKILLFTTPWNFSATVQPLLSDKKYGFIRKLFNISSQSIMGSFPPLGLMYLSSTLKKGGHEVRILDGLFTTEEELFNEMEREEYGIFGLSVYTAGWINDQLMIEKIKKRFPETDIVIGGPHVNGWKANCFKDTMLIDYLIHGDGEYAFLELINSIEQKRPLHHIKGLIWKDKNTGEIIENEAPNYIQNIDGIPYPDWDAVDIYRYKPTLTNYKKLPIIDVIGSRGCPFGCIFCAASRVVRKRSAKSILDEIDILVNKYGIKDITFYDETFTVFRERTMELCDELIKRDYDLIWAANARADCVDKEMVIKMKKAGCWRLLLGVETGAQRISDIMKKGTTIEDVENAVRLAKAVGIEVHGTMLFGTPGETYEEGLQTIKFACDLDLDYVAFGSLALLPGTEVFNMVADGKKVDFAKQSVLKIGYVPDSMTIDELKDLMNRGYKQFYYRPSYILKRLKKIRSFEDLRKNIVGALGFMGIGGSEVISS